MERRTFCAGSCVRSRVLKCFRAIVLYIDYPDMVPFQNGYQQRPGHLSC